MLRTASTLVYFKRNDNLSFISYLKEKKSIWGQSYSSIHLPRPPPPLSSQHTHPLLRPHPTPTHPPTHTHGHYQQGKSNPQRNLSSVFPDGRPAVDSSVVPVRLVSRATLSIVSVCSFTAEINFGAIKGAKRETALSDCHRAGTDETDLT